jgi:hypothetical protein
MLAMPRARADVEGVTNLELRMGDAASLDVDVELDVVLARWGLMYATI